MLAEERWTRPAGRGWRQAWFDLWSPQADRPLGREAGMTDRARLAVALERRRARAARRRRLLRPFAAFRR